MHIVNAVVLDEADVISAAVDAGVGAGLMRIYDATGGIPSDADVAISTQVLLAEITLNDPSFAAAADSNPDADLVLDVTPIPEDSSANATGTAAFARLVTSAGATVVQFDDVTVTGGGGEVEINSVAIQAGAAVQVTAGTITVPEG